MQLKKESLVFELKKEKLEETFFFLLITVALIYQFIQMIDLNNMSPEGFGNHVH